ncbi:protein QUIRKY [Diospyros lotus]|uniref:protein QUIRKY n=1 Tax=Diospyros lotus TaxID=55363 RepID=UPI002256BA62|nr:protein QUIRKY [Diospyros lotus]
MASSTRKLIVEVIDARELLPKDGHGTSSPYVIVDYYGQRKRTKTVARDLNPTWNELLDFNVGKPSDVFGDVLELDVYHDKSLGPTTRTNFLGRVRLSSGQFVTKGEEALIYYPLEKKHLFSWVQGKIGLKIYFVDEPVAPPPPPPPAAEDVKPPDEIPPTEPQPADQEAKTAETAADTNAGNSDPSAEAAPAPPAEKPSDGGDKPSEDQPQAPPSAPESAAAEKDNTAPGSDAPPPPEEGDGVPMEPPPPPPPILPEAKAFTATRSVSEINMTGLKGPRPISRAASVSSFTSDLSDTVPIERSAFDLVNKMHYLFVRVVKARSLPTKGNPIVKIAVSGCVVGSSPARKMQFFEWDQTFAFGRDSPDFSTILEVSVWDPPRSSAATPASDVAGHNFLGGICFDVSEIPLRDPPDSPLAPQWYRLEGGGAHSGDLMLATWVGTQADESFPDAWKTDTAGNPNSRSKVYQSPKLWYLRLTVLEAQDILPLIPSRQSSSLTLHFQIKAQLGFQMLKTRPAVNRNGSPSWNEDLVFVAAEPFADQQLIIFLESKQPKESVRFGIATIPLTSIERRVDDRQIAARWFSLDDPNAEKRIYKGRLQLRVCFDGGYHVMDEAAHVCSDYRPTARQLWKPSVGTVELGIVGCRNLLPMKTINGKGSTDAYAVAKYGNKWVRTRTISDSLDPKWNEQYTWRVYDPSTVLTVGVFDSWEAFDVDAAPKESVRADFRLGKVRIRVSTLQMGTVYKNTYPLMMLTPAGLKKMGEIELAVRFVRSTGTLDFLHVYSQPLLPVMHHIRPLGLAQLEMLRSAAVKIVAAHLTRSEPPLRREVVSYILDADSHGFSMRKVRANWIRIVRVVAGVDDVVKWVNDTRAWRKPSATVLVHALVVMLVWYPDLIIPALAFYLFVVGAWNYRFRGREPPAQFDPKLSMAEAIDRDELEEEFDGMPSGSGNEVVRARYDKLRNIGARLQTVLGDIATQGERMQALVTWRDPRATAIFVGLCLLVALLSYVVPSKMVAMAFGFYYLRHPIFRDGMPSPALNFFRRLPSLSDRIM